MLRTLLAVLTFSAVAGAATISFTTPGGSVDTAGDPVSATATITTSTNTVTIDLFNNLTTATNKDVGQNLSDFSFTLGGFTFAGTVNDTNRVYSGQLIDVGTAGAVALTTGTFNGWDFSNTGNTFTLEDLGSLAGPAQTILGGTAGSLAAYTAANGSIDNNGPHNPFLQGTAHFVLTIAGVTSSTTVSAPVFSFGTTLGDNIGGNVPEPVTSALVGIGLIGLAFVRRRRVSK